jgi:hypothetical protein
VFTVKGRFEETNVTKLNAEYTPTINTHQNIVKNKLPDVFARNGRFKKVDVNAEYAPTIYTLRNIVTGNIKHTVKEPWSALNGSATLLGCKLPKSAQKNLQSLATTPLTR